MKQLLLFCLLLSHCGGGSARPPVPVPPPPPLPPVVEPIPPPIVAADPLIYGFTAEEVAVIEEAKVLALEDVKRACAAHPECTGETVYPGIWIFHREPQSVNSRGLPCLNADPVADGGCDRSVFNRFGGMSITLQSDALDRLARHEIRHAIGATSHPSWMCGGVPAWQLFGHGGPCDLTGGP